MHQIIGSWLIYSAKRVIYIYMTWHMWLKISLTIRCNFWHVLVFFLLPLTTISLSGWRRCQGHWSIIRWRRRFICRADCHWYTALFMLLFPVVLSVPFLICSKVLFLTSRFRWINGYCASPAGSYFSPGIWYSLDDLQLLAQSSTYVDKEVISALSMFAGCFYCHILRLWFLINQGFLYFLG